MLAVARATLAGPFHGVTLASPEGLSSPEPRERLTTSIQPAMAFEEEEEIHYVHTASKGL